MKKEVNNKLNEDYSKSLKNKFPTANCCLFLEIEENELSPYLLNKVIVEGLYMTTDKSIIKYNCKSLKTKRNKKKGVHLCKIDDFCLITVVDSTGTISLLISRDIDLKELKKWHLMNSNETSYFIMAISQKGSLLAKAKTNKECDEIIKDIEKYLEDK